MPDVAMPRLSDSMEEGTILKWLRGEGEQVAAGDELVEIETDKANMTYEAEAGGVLSIVAAEGDTLPVGAVIARLSQDGTSATNGGGAENRGAAATEPAPAEDTGTADPPVPTEAPAADPDPVTGEGPDGDRAKASPVARRMARELGIALDEVKGSGPGGRILKSDVEGAAGRAAAPAPAPAPAATSGPAPAATPPPAPGTPADAAPARPGTAKGEVRVRELSRLQQTVARRMAESKATAPDFELHVDVDMGPASDLREQLKALGGTVPSVNDLVVKASALALREFPRANGAYRDGRFELYSRVNVGVAVAARDALVVPTIFDADTKSLARIATEARSLAEKVRAGVVTPPEVSGGTFTVSNLGMYGMRRIVPVINPPQAAILGVGAIEDRAVVRNGAVVPGRVMALTLVCDHRILYGADAAGFLSRIRELLERPVALVVEPE